MIIDKFYNKQLSKNLNIVEFNKSGDLYEVALETFDVAIAAIDFENEIINHDKVRKQLYDLFLPNNLKIIDLGNIIYDVNQTTEIFQKIQLLFQNTYQKNLPLIILSNIKKINKIFVNYFKSENLKFKHLAVSPNINIENDDDEYLNYYIENNETVHKITYLGYQNFLVNAEELKRIDNKSFTFYRLSEVQHDVLDFEPDLRDSESIFFDMSSVKFSDCPATKNSQPNGFSSYEICKLSYLTGLSDNILFFNLFGYYNYLDINEISAKLVSQIIWHFLASVESKKKINLMKEKFENFYVIIDQKEEKSIKFAHCENTDRWWFLSKVDEIEKYIPCSFKDYLEAKNGRLTIRLERYLTTNKL